MSIFLTRVIVVKASKFNEYFSKTTDADVVIVDINLPDGSGYNIVSRLRETNPDVGIIIITCRNVIEDRLYGMDSRADVYLVKHADLREIEANIRSIIRRRENKRNDEKGKQHIWLLDKANWSLRTPDNVTIPLTHTEFALLTILINRRGEAVSREEINAQMGRHIKDTPDRAIDAIIKRLRDKVASQSGIPFPLNIVYGKGYTFTADVSVTE